MKAYKALLKAVADEFKSKIGQKISDYEETFDFMVRQFRKAIQSPMTTDKEATLAVLGYGSLAAASKTYLGSEAVKKMCNEVIAKTQEVFLSPDFTEDKLVNLPGYVQAMADVLNVASGEGDNVEPSTWIEVEQIMIHLVKRFPSLPPQYQGFATDAFTALLNCSSRLRENVVYQAVVQTCSHPVVTKTDIVTEVVDDTPGGIVSTLNYIPFWNNLFKKNSSSGSRSALVDAFMLAITELLERLNFNVDTIEVSVNPEFGNIIASSQPNDTILNDSLLLNETKDDDNNGGNSDTILKKVKKPAKIKDHTILTNLVLLSEKCLFKIVAHELLRPWMQPLLYEVMRKSTKHPEVSGLYRFFHLLIQKADFDENNQDFMSCVHYLEDVLAKCYEFEQELLKSTLELVIGIPVKFVKFLIVSMPRAIAKVFRLGQLDLAEKGIDALNKWCDSLGHKVMKPLLVAVIPHLKKFLDDGRSEMLEESSALAEKVKSKKASKKQKSANGVVDESDHERVQKKILLFFGNMSADLHDIILPSVEELGRLATAWNPDRQLKFAVPFHDQRPEIFLDDLLPRLVELSLNSKHRRTRVAACELLHVVVLFMIGKSASQSRERNEGKSLIKLYEHVFPAMLKLAGDEDKVIGQSLFEKLLLQIIHWFTVISQFFPWR